MKENTSILDFREARAKYQKRLLAQYGGTWIVVKANYPGANKNNAEARLVVSEVAAEIKQTLPVSQEFQTITAEGLIVYLQCFLAGHEAKQHMMTIEEQHALGRLADIDVMDQVQSYSRLIPRRCYLCDQEAHACARSQAHTQEAVMHYFHEVVGQYLHNKKEGFVWK